MLLWIKCLFSPAFALSLCFFSPVFNSFNCISIVLFFNGFYCFYYFNCVRHLESHMGNYINLISWLKNISHLLFSSPVEWRENGFDSEDFNDLLSLLSPLLKLSHLQVPLSSSSSSVSVLYISKRDWWNLASFHWSLSVAFTILIEHAMMQSRSRLKYALFLWHSLY